MNIAAEDIYGAIDRLISQFARDIFCAANKPISRATFKGLGLHRRQIVEWAELSRAHLDVAAWHGEVLPDARAVVRCLRGIGQCVEKIEANYISLLGFNSTPLDAQAAIRTEIVACYRQAWDLIPAIELKLDRQLEFRKPAGMRKQDIERYFASLERLFIDGPYAHDSNLLRPGEEWIDLSAEQSEKMSSEQLVLQYSLLQAMRRAVGLMDRFVIYINWESQQAMARRMFRDCIASFRSSVLVARDVARLIGASSDVERNLDELLRIADANRQEALRAVDFRSMSFDEFTAMQARFAFNYARWRQAFEGLERQTGIKLKWGWWPLADRVIGFMPRFLRRLATGVDEPCEETSDEESSGVAQAGQAKTTGVPI